ncbi:MAG: YjbQ family protein [Thermotogae bacterium]|nr:YjbQ family protein [Thermotogota bacterium]
MIYTLSVRSSVREEMIDITPNITDVIFRGGVKNGICYLYVPHTTAAITINENADPSVKADIIEQLKKTVPYGRNYKHLEGNADAHIKSTLVGVSLSIFIKNGRLVLGRWQGIFFCEFDGPRNREVHVKIIPED